jgi:large subunit ribosomal protein L33
MQEQVTLECTEAKKEGKPASRYLTFRNKKTVTERIEKKKYNPFLKRHTLHKEIKWCRYYWRAPLLIRFLSGSAYLIIGGFGRDLRKGTESV